MNQDEPGKCAMGDRKRRCTEWVTTAEMRRTAMVKGTLIVETIVLQGYEIVERMLALVFKR